MDFFKKYWTHMVSLGFLVYTVILFILIGNGLFENIDVRSIFILFGILIFFVGGVWVEIIYHIIHAAKHKEIKNNALCAVLCYFFNVVYIPCYSLKNVSKDEKYRQKNIIYLVVSILLYFVMCGVMIRFELNELKYETYISQDNVVSFKLPNEYYQMNLGQYDLYFRNDYSNIGVFIYDGYNLTDDDILDYHEQEMINTRENMSMVDSSEDVKNNKVIKTHVYEGVYDGDENIYCFSVISFSDKPNYIVYVVEITLKEDYIDSKSELKQIINDINLKN